MSDPTPHPLHRYPAPSGPPITGASVAPLGLGSPNERPGAEGKRAGFLVAVAAAVLVGAVGVQLVPRIIDLGTDGGSGSRGEVASTGETPSQVVLELFDALGNDSDRVAAVLAFDGSDCFSPPAAGEVDVLSQMLDGVQFSDAVVERETFTDDGKRASVAGTVRLEQGTPSEFRVLTVAETRASGGTVWRVCDLFVE